VRAFHSVEKSEATQGGCSVIGGSCKGLAVSVSQDELSWIADDDGNFITHRVGFSPLPTSHRYGRSLVLRLSLLATLCRCRKHRVHHREKCRQLRWPSQAWSATQRDRSGLPDIEHAISCPCIIGTEEEPRNNYLSTTAKLLWTKARALEGDAPENEQFQICQPLARDSRAASPPCRLPAARSAPDPSPTGHATRHVTGIMPGRAARPSQCIGGRRRASACHATAAHAARLPALAAMIACTLP
jgi:hypothetical protein